jgi:hypothetical protein
VREPYHLSYRQELAEPVLERLEPEARCGEELKRRNGSRAVFHLFLAVWAGIPTACMAKENANRKRRTMLREVS